MYHQSPAFFEFNEKFLLEILDALFSCQFGTFLYNKDSERESLHELTHSLWSYINSNAALFINPHYRRINSTHKRDILFFPLCEIRYLKLWERCYLRHVKRLPRLGNEGYCHSLCRINYESTPYLSDELKQLATDPIEPLPSLSLQDQINTLILKKNQAVQNEQFLLAHKYKIQIEQLEKEQKLRAWTPSSPIANRNDSNSRKPQMSFLNLLRQENNEKQ